MRLLSFVVVVVHVGCFIDLSVEKDCLLGGTFFCDSSPLLCLRDSTNTPLLLLNRWTPLHLLINISIMVCG